MLKLPKNQDVNRLIEEIKECYIASMTPDEKLDPSPLPTTFILLQEGRSAKFYLILTGNLVEYDCNVLINRYLKQQKSQPAPHKPTAPSTIPASDPNPERISKESHRKVTIQQSTTTTTPAPSQPPSSKPANSKKIIAMDDEYGEEVEPSTNTKSKK